MVWSSQDSASSKQYNTQMGLRLVNHTRARVYRLLSVQRWIGVGELPNFKSYRKEVEGPNTDIYRRLRCSSTNQHSRIYLEWRLFTIIFRLEQNWIFVWIKAVLSIQFLGCLVIERDQQRSFTSQKTNYEAKHSCYLKTKLQKLDIIGPQCATHAPSEYKFFIQLHHNMSGDNLKLELLLELRNYSIASVLGVTYVPHKCFPKTIIGDKKLQDIDTF